MRTAFVVLALLVGVAGAIPAASAAAGRGPALASASVFATTLTDAQQPAGKDVNVDINVNRSGGRWYANPVWLAIGGLAVLLVIVLLVVALRGGGGTTIVRD